MILDDHRFIYIHIPKTGGRSVEKAFAFNPDPRLPIDDPFSLDRVERETEKHLPARLLQRSFPEAFATYFKACHVRNTWDFVVSAYFWLKAGCNLRREFRDWVMSDFADTPVRAMNLFMAPCQLDWITDDAGRIIVDFVGRFEDLPSNFPGICARIGAGDIALPHYNKTDHLHYSRYYDDETRERVAARYARDIAHFGFRFERG